MGKEDNIKKWARRLCGVIVLPLLYTRYSIIMFIPLIIMNYNFIFAWVFYVSLFSIIMMFGAMEGWTKLFESIFRVEYEIVGRWSNEMLHTYCVWAYPIVKIKGEEHNLSVIKMGGNLYEERDSIRRKAIMIWLFS